MGRTPGPGAGSVQKIDNVFNLKAPEALKPILFKKVRSARNWYGSGGEKEGKGPMEQAVLVLLHETERFRVGGAASTGRPRFFPCSYVQ